MNDLADIAEGVLREYLLQASINAVATELMEDDPECQLLTDDEWDRVAEMIADATVNIKVTIH